MTTTHFQLHDRLLQDCIKVGTFELCDLLLMNDTQFPWFILVPKRFQVSEIYQLNDLDRRTLIDESCFLSEQLALLYRADKMNIASIGNKVPQLHIHHVVRYQHDKAWPDPIWGKFAVQKYSAMQLEQTLQSARAQLAMKLHCIEE